MKYIKESLIVIIVLVTGLSLFWGCNKKEDDKLSVTTKQVVEITSNGAKSGGNVIVKGDISVSVCGVCWRESPSPTVNDRFTTDIQGDGEFISEMKNLVSGTTYYVRAYAITDLGVMYGEEKVFTTLSNGGGNGGGGNGGGNGGGGNGGGNATPSVIRVTNCTYNSVEISVSPTPQASYYNTQIAGEWDSSHHDASETSITISSLSPNTAYTFNFSFYDNGDNLIESQQVSATTTEQPYQSPYVTVELVSCEAGYLELQFTPSPNTAYYCFNQGEMLTSTYHNSVPVREKYENLLPNTEYVFSVVAYDNDGIVGEVIHPRFTTKPAPYANYYRIGNNFYELSYAKLVNNPTANAYLRNKEIQLWCQPGYWVRFCIIVDYTDTSNNWSGIYTTGGNYNSVGYCFCSAYKNGTEYGIGEGSTLTISKSGNMWTYDLYGDNGYVTAHFVGIPTY